MAVLVRLAADGSSRIEAVLTVPGTDVVIGRGGHVGLPLIDPSVSREHARLVLHPQRGRWTLFSLTPHNPVRLAGRGVEHVELAPGTEFSLGRVRLRFELQDPRDQSTVLMDGAAGANVIAQVQAAAQAQGSQPVSVPAAQPAPPNSPQRNPFLAADPPAPPPAAPSPTTGPSSPSPPSTPASSGAAPDVPLAPGRRPDSQLRRRRAWPIVLVAVVLAVGGVAAVFHQQLLGLVPPGLLGGDGGDGGGGGGDGESVEDDTAPLAPGDDPLIAKAAPDPSGALGGWLPTGDLDCGDLTMPTPTTGERGAIGKVFELKGRPTGMLWTRDRAGETALMLEFARDGQQLRFEGNRYRGGTEGPKDPHARPLPGALMFGQLDAETDPRCIVEQYGPAQLLLGGVPFPTDAPDAGVPIAWTLDEGGLMVTAGDELWMLRLGGGRGSSRDGAEPTPAWLGTVASLTDPTQPRALVVLHDRSDETYAVELLQAESSATHPSLIWKTAKATAGGMPWHASDADQVTTYVDGDAEGAGPTALRAALGLVDVPEPGRRTRTFNLAFELEGQPHAYAGVLVRTPWR